MQTKNFLLLALAPLFYMTSCTGDHASEGAAETVTISGTIEDSIRGPVTLWEVKAIGKDVQIAFDSASTPTFTLSAEIDEPGAYRLRYGRTGVTTFLTPGDDLKVEAAADDLPGTILFSGEGAEVNNYLRDTERQLKAYAEQQEEQNIYKLDEEGFTERVNDIEKKRSEIFNTRFGDGETSTEFKSFAMAEIQGERANLITNYPVYHGYYTGMQDFEVSPEYDQLMGDIDLNNESALSSPEYRAFLKSRAQQGMNQMIEADSTLSDDWPAAFQKYYGIIKEDKDLGNAAKELLLASHLNDYISYFGVDGVDGIYADFNSAFPESEFGETLKENYDSWARLAKGQPAPVFSYKSIDGEEVSLSDFEGKVVYVDVWATWCGPCKREIPSSKELKKELGGEDVVFLYVSVDDNQESWEDYLENDPEFKGVHLITGTGWKSEITEEYMISGIPRYMLIDRSGNIVSASAPRPSSGDKITSMIRETLSEGENPAGD